MPSLGQAQTQYRDQVASRRWASPPVCQLLLHTCRRSRRIYHTAHGAASRALHQRVSAGRASARVRQTTAH